MHVRADYQCFVSYRVREVVLRVSPGVHVCCTESSKNESGMQKKQITVTPLEE